MNRFDVIIYGGGMVGATLALALQRQGMRSCVIDRQPLAPWSPQQTQNRVCALNLASIYCLRALGVWRSITEKRAQPFEKIYVWEKGEGIEFDGSAITQPYLGYIVENQIINEALLAAAVEHGCHYLAPEKATGLRRENGRMVLSLESGQTLNASVVVGADGKNSQIRAMMNMAVKQWPLKHHALVATLQLEHNHGNTAWQKFLPTGPLAFLPLSGNRVSIVWSTSPAHCRGLQAMERNAFERELNRAFEHRFGALSLLGKTVSFPLQSNHAHTYVQPGLCLIGDAAHSIHPLAGQGVNLGILDSAALAETLCQAREKRRDLGHFQVLRRYERRRKGHNLLTLQAMEAFASFFAVQTGPLSLVRRMGLSLTNQVMPAKQWLMAMACGLHGDLPQLAQNPLAQSPPSENPMMSP